MRSTWVICIVNYTLFVGAFQRREQKINDYSEIKNRTV
jgi:hypothetical protein